MYHVSCIIYVSYMYHICIILVLKDKTILQGFTTVKIVFYILFTWFHYSAIDF